MPRQETFLITNSVDLIVNLAQCIVCHCLVISVCWLEDRGKGTRATRMRHGRFKQGSYLPSFTVCATFFHGLWHDAKGLDTVRRRFPRWELARVSCVLARDNDKRSRALASDLGCTSSMSVCASFSHTVALFVSLERLNGKIVQELGEMSVDCVVRCWCCPFQSFRLPFASFVLRCVNPPASGTYIVGGEIARANLAFGVLSAVLDKKGLALSLLRYDPEGGAISVAKSTSSTWRFPFGN